MTKVMVGPMSGDMLAGPVIGVVASNSLAFIDALFALERDGSVAVPLRSSDDAERIGAAGVGKIIEPGLTSGWAKIDYQPQNTPMIAQIAFTSGTTGTATAVALSHANIANTIARLTSVMAINDEIREYIGVPVAYSFGMGRARAVSAAGGHIYLPPHGFDPYEIGKMLGAGDINALSAVPTLMRVMLANADQIGAHGERLRWLEIGSQPMAASEKAALRALFPCAVIVQHYGLTQASRSTFLEIHRADAAALASVGRALAPVELRCDGDGQMLVRGPHVAAFKLEAGRLAALTDTEGWLATGDFGRLDGGIVYFEGRIDDQINCGGIKLQPDALERAINAELTGTVAVTRIADALRGDGILVAVESGSGLDLAAVQAAAGRVITHFGIHAGSALEVRQVDHFPRTETGKLRRSALAALCLHFQPLAEHPDEQLGDTSAEARLIALWKTVLGVATVTADDSFFDLGGDPLLGHALIEAMCHEGISSHAARGLWDGLNISQIIALDQQSSGEESVEDRILALWRGTLGRADVGLHEGFYDVGGDSLSAISLAINMERAGFSPELARAIFDGKTIAEIATEAGQAASDTPDSSSPPRRKSQIALFSESLNLVKGILVVAMIASHWLPIYLGYFGVRGGLISQTIQPFLSMGTPTLAFIFGIGIPVFHARQYAGSGTAFKSNIAKGSLLLLVGLLLGALLDGLAQSVQNEAHGLAMVTAALTGGPFVYFLVATATLPLWIDRLRGNKALGLVCAALAMQAGYLALRTLTPAEFASPITEALREILIGHWSLLQLGSFTLFGVVAGLMIEKAMRAQAELRTILPYGAIVLVSGLIFSAASGDLRSWITPHEDITLWSAISYSGFALVLIASYTWLSDWSRHYTPVRLTLQMLASLGILLFPLYVLQSLVYHSAAILTALTGRSLISMLSLCIVIFVALAFYPVLRVYRLYYGDRRA